jgi:hypothetical protein
MLLLARNQCRPLEGQKMNIAVNLDQAIIAAAQAWKDATARYAARCSAPDLPDDDVELHAAHADGEAAKDILCETAPQTPAGFRALLEYMASDQTITCYETNAIAENLLSSPVFLS